VLAGVTAALVRGLPWSDPSHLLRLALVLLMLIAMRSANERVHAVILFLSAGMMLLFIFLYHFRLN
jgi:hypothetical protein